MKLVKLRIQNFRCIADSGEISIDDHLTVLVGENEAGKSAILKALHHFNPGVNFEPVDLSQLSGFRDRLERKAIGPDDIDIVTVWISLSPEDRVALSVPEGMGNLVGVTKSWDNEYRLLDPLTAPPSPSAGPTTAAAALFTRLQAQLQSVYKGRVKRKLPSDQFVWLERAPGEDPNDNLVLFPEWAHDIWDDLAPDDWLQVTRIGPDPYRRNSRALNAGMVVDLAPINESLRSLLARLEQDGALDHSTLQALRASMGQIPDQHPLRDYFTPETMKEIDRFAQGLARPESLATDLVLRLVRLLPQFVYLPDLPDVSDSASLRGVAGTTPSPMAGLYTRQSEELLDSLVKTVGLQPETLLLQDAISRKKTLDDKSTLLSGRMREHWVKSTVAFEFDKDGERLGLWVTSDGSIDPPSRRSKGLSSYISLFATMAELSARKNVVALLDDPGVYLHPMAQRRLQPLLDVQPFQVIMATHLPFMIDPDHLERVRLVSRDEKGTRIEADWAARKESLLPVWGSLLATNAGRVWLLVEGKNDKRAYSRVSRLCASQGRQHVAANIPLAPGGGSTVPCLAEFLLEQGISIVALLDGDAAGLSMRDQLLGLPNPERIRVVLLSECECGLPVPTPRLEDLFASIQEFSALLSKEQGLPPLASATIDRFDRVFARVNEALTSLA